MITEENGGKVWVDCAILVAAVADGLCFDGKERKASFLGNRNGIERLPMVSHIVG